jgi:hypothetical protein
MKIHINISVGKCNKSVIRLARQNIDVKKGFGEYFSYFI